MESIAGRLHETLDYASRSDIIMRCRFRAERLHVYIVREQSVYTSTWLEPVMHYKPISTNLCDILLFFTAGFEIKNRASRSFRLIV
jgi:hypothetical protein